MLSHLKSDHRTDHKLLKVVMWSAVVYSWQQSAVMQQSRSGTLLMQLAFRRLPITRKLARVFLFMSH